MQNAEQDLEYKGPLTITEAIDTVLEIKRRQSPITDLDKIDYTIGWLLTLHEHARVMCIHDKLQGEYSMYELHQPWKKSETYIQ